MKSAVSTSDTLGLMLRDLDQFPMPDHEQQVELAKRVVAGDEAARKQMVAANLRLVVHWARRYQDRGVDMADLVQEGTFGLMRAVDKFDWERGFRFSTYATWWIRQALQRAVQQHGRTIRIPLEVGEQIQRLELTKSELASTLGRAPTEAELDEATGMTADERDSLEDVARVTASLDQPAALESSTTLGELVAPDESDFVADVEETMVYDRVRDAVERLPDLQRDVLRLRFGFDGDSPASLQSTAERLGVGRAPGAAGRGGGPGCPLLRRRRARRARSGLTTPRIVRVPAAREASPPERQALHTQVLGQRRRELHAGACARVREGQAAGVQEEAPGSEARVGHPVAGVAHHRVPDGRHVDPDLVGPPALERELEQRRRTLPPRRSSTV